MTFISDLFSIQYIKSVPVYVFPNGFTVLIQWNFAVIQAESDQKRQL